MTLVGQGKHLEAFAATVQSPLVEDTHQSLFNSVWSLGGLLKFLITLGVLTCRPPVMHTATYGWLEDFVPPGGQYTNLSRFLAGPQRHSVPTYDAISPLTGTECSSMSPQPHEHQTYALVIALACHRKACQIQGHLL